MEVWDTKKSASVGYIICHGSDKIPSFFSSIYEPVVCRSFLVPPHIDRKLLPCCRGRVVVGESSRGRRRVWRGRGRQRVTEGEGEGSSLGRRRWRVTEREGSCRGRVGEGEGAGGEARREREQQEPPIAWTNPLIARLRKITGGEGEERESPGPGERTGVEGVGVDRGERERGEEGKGAGREDGGRGAR